ncbi:MAG TPA: hypothetical protein VJN02_06565 [Gammaproteobacteria bacterium]|nr:hypothetical protein [Gammaproteobacteria bacterium]
MPQSPFTKIAKKFDEQLTFYSKQAKVSELLNVLKENMNENITDTILLIKLQLLCYLLSIQPLPKSNFDFFSPKKLVDYMNAITNLTTQQGRFSDEDQEHLVNIIHQFPQFPEFQSSSDREKFKKYLNELGLELVDIFNRHYYHYYHKKTIQYKPDLIKESTELEDSYRKTSIEKPNYHDGDWVRDYSRGERYLTDQIEGSTTSIDTLEEKYKQDPEYRKIIQNSSSYREYYEYYTYKRKDDTPPASGTQDNAAWRKQDITYPEYYKAIQTSKTYREYYEERKNKEPSPNGTQNDAEKENLVSETWDADIAKEAAWKALCDFTNNDVEKADILNRFGHQMFTAIMMNECQSSFQLLSSEAPITPIQVSSLKHQIIRDTEGDFYVDANITVNVIATPADLTIIKGADGTLIDPSKLKDEDEDVETLLKEAPSLMEISCRAKLVPTKEANNPHQYCMEVIQYQVIAYSKQIGPKNSIVESLTIETEEEKIVHKNPVVKSVTIKKPEKPIEESSKTPSPKQ